MKRTIILTIATLIVAGGMYFIGYYIGTCETTIIVTITPVMPSV